MKKGSKRKEPTEKCILIEEIKEMLLESERLMGAVAELTFKSTSTLKSQLKSKNPLLAHALTMDAIKEVLGIWDEVVIYDTVSVEDKSLHHE